MLNPLEFTVENLSTELKTWLDLDNPEHQSKIIKALSALYNVNGGRLIIGFCDDNCRPDLERRPEGDVREIYSIDFVLLLLHRYCSSTFPVTLNFWKKDGLEYPVFNVGSGVKKIIGIKKPLMMGDKMLIQQNVAYVRAFKAGKFETKMAEYDEMNFMMEICIDNREANIARFMRRHFDDLMQQFTALNQVSDDIDLYNPFQNFVLNSRQRFLYNAGPKLNRKFAYLEASVNLNHKCIGQSLDGRFLERFLGANRNLSGWPFWLDVRQEGSTIEPYDNCFEGYICRLFKDDSFQEQKSHLDFWRASPEGYFYHKRVLNSDLYFHKERCMDPVSLITRICEIIDASINFARVFYIPDDKSANINIVLTGMKGRKLESWTNYDYHLPLGSPCESDQIDLDICIPVHTSLKTVSVLIYNHIKEVFSYFPGARLDNKLINDIIQQIRGRN